MHSPIHLAVIGEATRPEFRYALSNCFESAYTFFCTSILEILGSSLKPDAIILLQSYPNEFQKQNVEQLIESNPLATLILVTSSWSEGERRTGWQPITDAIRVPWYDFPFWLESQKKLFESGCLSQFSLPKSASDAQRAKLEFSQPLQKCPNDIVWIFSDTDTQRETLSRFHQARQSTVWSGGVNQIPPSNSSFPNPTKIVIVPDYLTEQLKEKIHEFRIQNPQTTIDVILYQPRIEEIEELRELGVDRILSPEFALI